MANAKQYNDLNTTTAVNSADKVALAQADKTELVTTTVGDLASAVGELNQAGALAELSLATSMGKNLLAQRLNEKGATDITPNNTLIEMADAVDGLQVTNSANLLKSRFFLGVANTPSKGTLGYSLFAWDDLGNGYTAVVASDTIYLFKKQGNYTSLPDAINHAEMSLPLTKIPTDSYGRCYMTSSQDGKTIIVTGVSSSSTVDVYSVDYEAKSISFVKNITVERYSADAQGLAISNDRKLLSIFSTWDAGYRIYSVDDTSKYATVNARPDESCVAGFAEDNRTLWLDKNTYDVNSYSYAITKISCTLSDSGDVSATIDLKQQYLYTPNKVVLDKHSMLLIKTGDPVRVDQTYVYSSYEGNIYTSTVSIADTRPNDISFIKVSAFSYDTKTGGSRLNYATIPVDCIKDGDIYTITAIFPYMKFTYDASTQTVTVLQNTVYASSPTSLGGDGTSVMRGIYYDSDKNILIAPISEYISTSSNYWSGAFIYKIDSISDEKLAGLKWTINGRDSYFVRYEFSDADIKAGRYDLTTKQVEIK